MSKAPVQRHITGVLKSTWVFDEKYLGIFQYPSFMMSHYRGIDKYPGIFHKIPGYLTACKIPGYMTAETTCCLYRHISGVLSFTDFSLSSSFECYVNGYYWKGVREGQGSDCKQNKGETIYLKDFEAVKSWRYLMGCSKEYHRILGCDSKCDNFGLNTLCLVKSKHYSEICFQGSRPWIH